MADAGEARGRSGVSFEENPILNSPYEEPTRRWPLDDRGRPKKGRPPNQGRRSSEYVVPVPGAKSELGEEERRLKLDVGRLKSHGLVDDIREALAEWRAMEPGARGITPITEELLDWWGEGDRESVDPPLFFCQREAMETLIWLNEVAERDGRIWRKVAEANQNFALLRRVATKMATGSGKTTVMAMLIAYHALNRLDEEERGEISGRFCRNFLVVAPGITVRDRLRVLLPSSEGNYYATRSIVSSEHLERLQSARVVVANYHQFKIGKESLTKEQRAVIEGHKSDEEKAEEEELRTESPDEMLARVWGGEHPKGSILVINDEAHHCYRDARPSASESKEMDDDEKEEVKERGKMARLWINGIEELAKKRGVHVPWVHDLSATPFFLKGSGYPEGVLFPWVVSDFSLLDAIESGVVKIPRVPVRDSARGRAPINRGFYQIIKKELREATEPEDLPSELMGALHSLYQHYEETFRVWKETEGIEVPPAFIIVCNNTRISRLVYRFVSGGAMKDVHDWTKNRLTLFHNSDEQGRSFVMPNTLLIDSRSLEAGDSMPKEFREEWSEKIERIKRERRISAISDGQLLREMLNTVGKEGELGAQVRCIVSVSMLTEGWDAQNVTHVLGVRAFGTQLLCEQVVGRALRRLNYEEFQDRDDDRKIYKDTYAEIFGVPFTFAQGTIDPPPSVVKTVRVRALPERRRATEIRFPRVLDYFHRIPTERLRPVFDDEKSRFTIHAKDAPPDTETEGSIGRGEIVSLRSVMKYSESDVVFRLTRRIAYRFFQDGGRAEDAERPNVAPQIVQDLIPIVRHWVRNYFENPDGVPEGYLSWGKFGQQAAEKIHAACAEPYKGDPDLLTPVLDRVAETGTTINVDFLTSKKRLFEPSPGKCHINLAVCDSDWEKNFCGMLEANERVLRYVRNDRLGFRVPYTHARRRRAYQPDFIAVVNDGRGPGDLLHLVLEIKGKQGRKARTKAATMHDLWVPAINNIGRFGRWGFAELLYPQTFESDLRKLTHPEEGKDNGET